MRELLTKISNLFKLGRKKSTVSPKLIEVMFQGKTQKAVLMVPYGIFSNPKNDLPTGILSDQCNEQSLMAFPFDIDKGWSELAPRIVKVKSGHGSKIWMSIAASVIVSILADMRGSSRESLFILHRIEISTILRGSQWLYDGTSRISS